MRNRILALFLLIFLHVNADNRYNYTYYQMEDGLCDEFVFSVYEDSFGFMWFCTSNGLDRFDGHEFVHYSSTALEKTHRINSNFVKRVVEDKHKHLWIISDVGLQRINIETGQLEICADIELDNIELLSQPVQALFADQSGNLWLGLSNYVVYVCLDNQGEIEQIESFPTSNTITAFTQQDHIVWAGGISGICKYSIGADNKIVALDMIELSELQSLSNIQAIYVYGRYLWVGTQDGLYCYDTHHRKLEAFRHKEEDCYSISGNHITSLSANKSGDMIIGTKNGINLYTRHNRFERIVQSPDEASINTNLVNAVFVDHRNALWIGTSTGGVNLITEKKINVNHFLKEKRNAENIVNRMFEDKQGNLFVNIINKGLAVRYSGEESFRLYTFAKELRSLAGKDIRSIKQDYNNDYWIATTEGLNLLKQEDLRNPKFITFTTLNSAISSNVIQDLAIDSIRKGLWVCCNNGIDFIDIETHHFTHINCSFDSEELMRNLIVMCLDRKDNLWLGGNGLYQINLAWKENITELFQCKYYRYKLDDQSSKITERITSIIETKDGDIYIGSLNHGLYFAERPLYSEYSFRNVEINQATSNTKISNIQEDASGNLWISTLDGVFYFDTQTKRARKYDKTDGLPIHGFYMQSGCLLQDGSAAFGTINGFLKLSLLSPLYKTEDRDVIISHITCDSLLLAGSSITNYDIYPDKQSFEIFFSALEYSGQNKIAYAYKIDQLDPKWHFCANRNYVRYTNLPHGKYTFRVKCTNVDNLWSEHESVLTINVHPTFYQTIWFFLLIVLLLLSIILFVIWGYVRHQKKIQQYLKEEVLKRTHNLLEQKSELEQKTTELNEMMNNLIYSRNEITQQNLLLQSQNQEIKKQKDRIEAFSKEMEKINKEKLMLFTSLTHEFKTPLTLILGPIRKIAEMNKNEKLSDLIQIIERNAQHLLFLLMQIMDMRRVDAQELRINEKEFDITDLFQQDIADFCNLLRERHITLEFRKRVFCNVIKSDKQFIHTILFNLISNAIKHTPDHGTITVRLAQFAVAGSGKIRQFISVTNTGSYIAEEEREKIFDCFYKIEQQPTYSFHGQSSTGIGLFLVKQMTQALNGSISLKSLHHQGTTFRVCVPVVLPPKEEDLATAVLANINAENTKEMPFVVKDATKPVLLVVEDSRDMREYIKGFLSDFYNVAEAVDGEQGLRMAKSIIPDLIISDMMMPKLDGLMFCEKIRTEESLSHIPFLMLTALSDENVRSDCYNRGVDSFLTKPFVPKTLLARIDNIFKSYRKRQNILAYDLSQAHSSVLIKDADKLFLEKVIDIMKENFSDPHFNVAELLECMAMSNTSFYKKLKALTGLSASSFMRLYRLQTAKKMIDSLGNQTINISEIAYRVGFNDPKYFTRCFVKQYKVAPSTLINKKIDE